MQLKFLGVGSAFNPNLGSNNAYFIHNNNFFLIDCGQSAFKRLWNMQKFRDAQNKYVIITHMHNDHVGSLAALASWRYAEYNEKISVIHPNKNIIQLLNLMEISQKEYNYFDSFPGIDEVKVEFIPVTHTPNMESFGLKITVGEKPLYYGGDSNGIPANIANEFFQNKIGKIYQDITIGTSSAHMKIDELVALFDNSYRNRIYCMHLESDLAIQKIKQAGFNVVTKEK